MGRIDYIHTEPPLAPACSKEPVVEAAHQPIAPAQRPAIMTFIATVFLVFERPSFVHRPQVFGAIGGSPGTPLPPSLGPRRAWHTRCPSGAAREAPRAEQLNECADERNQGQRRNGSALADTCDARPAKSESAPGRVSNGSLRRSVARPSPGAGSGAPSLGSTAAYARASRCSARSLRRRAERACAASCGPREGKAPRGSLSTIGARPGLHSRARGGPRSALASRRQFRSSTLRQHCIRASRARPSCKHCP
mmetsp:Transcript_115525/g.331588  ORF Transcript_115525/g.331588 Transcript_115525/m.331588 type:complete len:251 (-) Transcript_115525:819-1571(-)